MKILMAFNKTRETVTQESDMGDIEVEAKKDAHELRDVELNPYPKDSFAALVYTLECMKIYNETHDNIFGGK